MELVVLAISKKGFHALLVVFFFLNFFGDLSSRAQLLVPDEVEALKEIAQTLRKKDWDFSVDPCHGQGWSTRYPQRGSENKISCNCTYANNSICHVIGIELKSQSLSGVLPPEIVKLPYLKTLDLTRNYLNGSIPKEWGSTKLVYISLIGNRLSGSIPVEIANISTLISLSVEFNNMSGVIPPELGLSNIEKIMLCSNQFTGPLPETLAKLTKLRFFEINDNQFSGKIPNFIQNWTNLQVLQMQASGLNGPIPSGIASLTKLVDMRISDLSGTEANFPSLQNLTSLKILILRSCNIIGPMPAYLGNMANLSILDLSFNKLSGSIPSSYPGNLKSTTSKPDIFLTGNALSGPIPPSMSADSNDTDLSYNDLTFGSSGPSHCQHDNINLFGSSSRGNNSNGIVPCLKTFKCKKTLYHSFRINCGGRQFDSGGNGVYDDDTFSAGPSTFNKNKDNWAFSSTGTFVDNQALKTYIETAKTSLKIKDGELYKNARIAPTSLTYYGFCLHNGNYSVDLHFAEIKFTNDELYTSLGRRIFNIYIQGKLVQEDFNIAYEAGGVGKAVIKTFTALVTDNTLDIRFYWAGKGTTAMPNKGTYGPLVSAISVYNDASENDGKISTGIIVGIVISVLIVIVVVLGALRWKRCFFWTAETDKGLRGQDLQIGSFTLRQIKLATNNFDVENKVGEGGFGPVYKGQLLDDTIIAVKQLSSKSSQGNREFVNEIGLISALQHPNLVKLYGCCTEANQLLLIYEYMENNSLARALFGEEKYQIKLDWPTRHKICVDLARALAYLHEESRLKIVHRDIKATNVLLDKDLNAKVSDFGFAKLDDEQKSHISTRVAGTVGYMAPEYALKGHLTDKADVYSFGIVALEIVSGRNNTDYRAKEECVYLLEWALFLKERGDILELVDSRLESNCVKEEVLRMINVALQCASPSPSLRPTMSSVVSVLEGQTPFQTFVSDQCMTDNQTEMVVLDDGPWITSPELNPVDPNSQYWINRDENNP